MHTRVWLELEGMIPTENNIFKCPKCNHMIISEELGVHQCDKKVVDYRIENNILWLSDGEKWYPRKLLSLSPTESQQRNKTTGEPTEPIFSLISYHAIAMVT